MGSHTISDTFGKKLWQISFIPFFFCKKYDVKAWQQGLQLKSWSPLPHTDACCHRNHIKTYLYKIRLRSVGRKGNRPCLYTWVVHFLPQWFDWSDKKEISGRKEKKCYQRFSIISCTQFSEATEKKCFDPEQEQLRKKKYLDCNGRKTDIIPIYTWGIVR